jgi:Cap4 SAVED domain
VDDLGFDLPTLRLWFPQAQIEPYILIRVTTQTTTAWRTSMPAIVRRCYVVDSVVSQWAEARAISPAVVIASKLPDPGSVMSGDFGEIVAYLYQSLESYPVPIVGVKKWRLKQDRRKPAPHSDVVHFVLPNWPSATVNDRLICSEVKAKSTPNASIPIAEALRDLEKDVTSRLTKTLVWLRERARTEDLGDVTIAHLDRFIDTPDYPLATRQFRAVAVVCDSLADDALLTVPTTLPPNRGLVVIIVPGLKDTYTDVFQAAVAGEQ